MRVREWYSWHFPELVKIVNDNYQYAQVGLAGGFGSVGALVAQASRSRRQARPLNPKGSSKLPLCPLPPCCAAGGASVRSHEGDLLLPPPPCCPCRLQLTLLIKDKSSLGEDKLEAIKEIVGEEDKAREILEVGAGRWGWGLKLVGGASAPQWHQCLWSHVLAVPEPWCCASRVLCCLAWPWRLPGRCASACLPLMAGALPLGPCCRLPRRAWVRTSRPLT